MREEMLTFTGPFSNDIQEFLEMQVALGHTKKSYIYNLKSLDTFSKTYNYKIKYLTKEIVESWMNSKPDEKINNKAIRATTIRNFGKYLYLKDKKSYILPKELYNKTTKYVAHIYSEEELKKFFKEIELSVQRKPDSHSANSAKVIFCLLYMCGLRISETLNIKVKDFDKEKKIITIYKGKNGKDRIIPLNNYLTTLIADYINKFHKYMSLESFLFEHKNGKPYSRFTMNHHFWKILEKCNIYHSKEGPRIHDFRHTFAVHCLKRWCLERKDLNAYLPILKTYLGHTEFKSTAYYLKLTANVYPIITNKLEKKYNTIIPQLGGEKNE